MTPTGNDFDFRIERYRGIRIIIGYYPRKINVSTLSTTISRYYDLWDEDEPTAQLSDLSMLETFGDEAGKVLLSVIQRTMLQRTFVGSTWNTGDNSAIHDEIVDVLHAAGRTSRSVFNNFDQALAVLHTYVDRWIDGEAAQSKAAGDSARPDGLTVLS